MRVCTALIHSRLLNGSSMFYCRRRKHTGSDAAHLFLYVCVVGTLSMRKRNGQPSPLGAVAILICIVAQRSGRLPDKRANGGDRAHSEGDFAPKY
jgi:hypothetical protein